MQVKITKGCIGCGLCSEICPEVFEIGEEGVATVIGEITADSLEFVQDAATNCPIGCIEIEE